MQAEINFWGSFFTGAGPLSDGVFLTGAAAGRWGTIEMFCRMADDF